MFDELKVFLTVAEAKNFTKAAKQLNFSQPAISQQIKKLEAYFNAPLLLRSLNGKQIELTEEGRLVCRYGWEILTLLDELNQALEARQDSSPRLLHVGASMTIGTHLLPLIIQVFHGAHPEIAPKLFIGNTRQVCDKLAEDELDIGLIEGISMYHDFIRTDFYHDPLVLVASPALAPEFQEFSPSRLGRATWIVREAGSGTAQYLQAFLESNHITVADRIECNSNEANRALVVEGLGITFISMLAVARELRSGALVRLPMNRSYKRNLSYIVRRDRPVPPAVDAFVEVLSRASADFPLDLPSGGGPDIFCGK